ncbi:MAG: hypothetical protein MRECE_1c128 [Mycoplasmataceae bacterium CE_OT135]|nr:MAG: hypothetical protein MRECE_1c041 [Mycoplasmataceae bacterium CE_OT135]KLL04357.1 MAG: hypothetical protein MRECE_1c128 [Mycoplasmataceae bacterium CE_OT135]
MVKWDKEKNAWVYLKDDEIIWQPPQEEKQEQPEQQIPNRGEPQQQPNPRENNPNPEPQPNPPVEEPQPNSTSNNEPVDRNIQNYPKCAKCGKTECPPAGLGIWNERNNEEFNTEGWCGLCVNNEHFKLCARDGNGIWILFNKEEWKRKKIPKLSEYNQYTCERCNTSCWNEREGVYAIRRIRHTDLNFREEVHYFSENCSCAEEFKRQHQQTCAQCQKREWPDMKKGWALDYGLKTIFCSPMCHYKYHKNLWEQEQRERNRGLQSYTPGDVPNATVLSWVEKTKLYPMELELSSGDDKSSKDKTTAGKGTSKAELEKIASKKEILTLKEFSKALKKESVKSTTDPKLSKEEKEMANYFLKLVESSEEKAKADFENKYGKAELNSLLNAGETQQPKKNYWPLIIGGGLVVAGIIGLLIYFLGRKQNLKRK